MHRIVVVVRLLTLTNSVMERRLSYANSDALSPEHYKLVTALQGSNSTQVSHGAILDPVLMTPVYQATTSILATQLAKIHTRLNRSQTPVRSHRGALARADLPA